MGWMESVDGWMDGWVGWRDGEDGWDEMDGGTEGWGDGQGEGTRLRLWRLTLDVVYGTKQAGVALGPRRCGAEVEEVGLN